MKKITVYLLTVWLIQGLSFAQKSDDIEALKQATYDKYASEFDVSNYDDLNKWIIYGLGEKSTPMHPEHKSAMIYILNGEDVIAHYYFVYDNDFGYSDTYCNCCHVEMEAGEGLIAHCEDEEVCTKPPFTQSNQLVALLPYINRSRTIELIRYPVRP